jgi:hypothetical protein
LSCLSILVTGGANWANLPIYLDTDKDTRPSIDDSSNEMFVDTWTDEIVYDLSFPLTDKNYRILNPMLSGGSFDLKPKELDITMVYNTNVMSQDKMRASVNGFHKDGRFYVTVYNSQSFARKSKELLLKDIELEQDIFHNDNMNNFTNSLGKSYVDGGPMYRYPIETMFSSLPSDWYLDADHQRPWIFLLPLLRKGFLQLGYSFKSPFLESLLGRRILCYLLDDDFNKYFPKKDEIYKPFSYQKTAINVPRNYISQSSYNVDPTIKVDKNGYTYLWFDKDKKINTYSNNARVNFDFNIQFLGTSNASIFGGTIEITIKVFSGEEEIDSSVVTMEDKLVDLNSNYSFFTTINVNRQRPLSIRYKINKKREIQITSGLKIDIVKQFIPNLSQYPLNKILNKTTLFDLLRGVSQLFSGYLDIDQTGRVLTLYTPYDVKVYDYEFEGYFKFENKILKNLAKDGSEVILPTEESFKYVELGFKPLVEEEEVKVEGKKKASLYGTFLDMGNDLSPNTLNLLNTYFEPTKNKSFPIGSEYEKDGKKAKETIIPLVVGVNSGTMENVGNRITFAYGSDNFERVGDQNVTKEMFPKAKYSKSNLLFNVFSAYQKLPDEYKIEQDYEVFDLSYESKNPSTYELIRPWIIANNFKQIARVDVLFTPLDFLNFNKRYGYSFYKKDTWVTGTFINMSDYKPCEDSVVTIELGINDPLTYQPIKLQEVDALASFIEEGEFDFLIVKNECTYDVEAINPNDVDVFGYLWHYTDETDPDLKSLPVVNPNKDFYVIAYIVDIGNAYTVVKEQKVCEEIESLPIVEILEEEHRLTILNISEDIDTISYTLKEKDKEGEEVETTYNGSYENRPLRPTEDLLEVCYSEIEIAKKCECGTIEYEDICWQQNLDCDELEISLEIINEDRTYKPIRVDNIKCCIAQDLIFYKTKIDDPWELMRLEETVYANDVWFKRVVIFNNDICTTKTFEIKANEDVFS